jgi:hypothetical protein
VATTRGYKSIDTEKARRLPLEVPLFVTDYVATRWLDPHKEDPWEVLLEIN